MMKRNQPSSVLHALVIRDNRPGHFNQSEGIILALEQMFVVKVKYLELQRKPILPARLVRWLITRKWLSQGNLLRLLRVSEKKFLSNKIDIIVSAGSDTLPHNVALSRIANAPNIFSGSIRGISPDEFSAVLHVNPKLGHRKNHIIGLKPSTVDRVKGFSQTKVFQNLCLLVGGPTRYQPSKPAHWAPILNAMSNSTLDWTIVTSRRTPNNITSLFADLVKKTNKGRLYDYRKAGSGVAAEIIKESDAIVVTEDSTSMISEGIASGLPVISLMMEGGEQSSDASYIQLMRTKNWYRSMDFEETTEEKILSELALCTPTTESHLDILAVRLFEQIPELKRFQRK